MLEKSSETKKNLDTKKCILQSFKKFAALIDNFFLGKLRILSKKDVNNFLICQNNEYYNNRNKKSENVKEQNKYLLFLN